MNKTGKVISINISDKKGIIKTPVDEAVFIEDFGIEGDAHAAKGKRQVSLLGQDSIDKMTAMGVEGLTSGKFAENLTVEGFELYELPVGTRLKIGETIQEVSQIGKECHTGCAIKQQVGKCVMPTEGIFTIVIKGGKVKKGDVIEIV